MKQRPTGTEARIKRHMRQAARRAEVATRAAAKAAHRNSLRTNASHLRALGIDDQVATGMAATLRKTALSSIPGCRRAAERVFSKHELRNLSRQYVKLGLG